MTTRLVSALQQSKKLKVPLRNFLEREKTKLYLKHYLFGA